MAMFLSATELMREVAGRIKIRRVAFGWPQQEAAKRAGVAYRTWRRLETEGHASIEDLVKAAIALRCEEGLAGLFPEPAATTLDELLKRQAGRGPNSPSPSPSPPPRSTRARVFRGRST